MKRNLKMLDSIVKKKYILVFHQQLKTIVLHVNADLSYLMIFQSLNKFCIKVLNDRMLADVRVLDESPLFELLIST